MRLRRAEPADVPIVVDMVDAAIRPVGAVTSARDDFPLALSADNADGLFVAEEEGRILACLATLVRPCHTSLGLVPVAAIGSVVTRPDRRGQGLSSALQEHALGELAGQAALAVLWTGEPGYYLSRGFEPAGLEYHLHLPPTLAAPDRQAEGPRADGSEVAAKPVCYTPAAADEVETLFRGHRWRTRRLPGDSARLYGMPGTVGHLVRRAGRLVAYAFVGKGADFPAWVLEWGGDAATVAGLLAWLVERQEVRHVLVPQGAEALRDLLVRAGATCERSPSGLWRVLDEGILLAALRDNLPAGSRPPDDKRATAWLGDGSAGAAAAVGPCRMAIWGFDSI